MGCLIFVLGKKCLGRGVGGVFGGIRFGVFRLMCGNLLLGDVSEHMFCEVFV